MNKRKQAKCIMIVGTGSDVGKSIVTTAFCRYYAQKGMKVAPFKAQNMALNSYVTIDGKEIGRAQGVQAEAAGIAATADNNPILLKPSKKNFSQVVVLGKPLKEMDYREYRETKHEFLKGVVLNSLNKLRDEHDLVIIEGAGSPVEMNLKDRDLVNMQVAIWAEADVYLVADIDRGGVFAQVVGTLALLTEEEKKLVKGVIINKFRGDISLFDSGIEWLEEKTGVPVIGVLPHIQLPEWEEEDSVALSRKKDLKENADLDIVFLQYPYLSNYTDSVALSLEEDVQIRYVKSVEDFGNPHVVILPGTKNTMDDLVFLQESGFADKLKEHVQKGRELVGICGGYQMLGELLVDPLKVESKYDQLAGLGLLPIQTTFFAEKKTKRAAGKLLGTEIPVFGYEIHMGKVEWQEVRQHMFVLEDGTLEGTRRDDVAVWGTFIHGVFDSDQFRHYWLNQLREKNNLPPVEKRISFSKTKEIMYNKLEEWFKGSLKVELL